MATTYELPPNIAPPLYLNLKQKRHVMVEGGSIAGSPLTHQYVYLGALPRDLQQKVIDAITMQSNQIR